MPDQLVEVAFALWEPVGPASSAGALGPRTLSVLRTNTGSILV
jgi:hypothetical protein